MPKAIKDPVTIHEVSPSGDRAIPFDVYGTGVVGGLASGWLGGEMVYIERVGVEEPGDHRKDRPRRVA